MKSKKLSPIQASGVGCLGGILFSILAIAAITLMGGGGSIIRIISYTPIVFAVIAYFMAKNRQDENNNQTENKDNEPKN